MIMPYLQLRITRVNFQNNFPHSRLKKKKPQLESQQSKTQHQISQRRIVESTPAKKNASQIRILHSDLFHRRIGRFSDLLCRSHLPYPPHSPLFLPPSSAPPSQASDLYPPFSDDRLRSRPPHLFHGRLRLRLRCHRRASRHRIHPRPGDRIRPTRGFSSRSRQWPVHHWGTLLWVHVCTGWNRNCADGPCSWSESREERQGFVCVCWDFFCCYCLCYEYAFHSY